MELQTNSVGTIRGGTKRFASSHETRSLRSPATPDVSLVSYSLPPLFYLLSLFRSFASFPHPCFSVSLSHVCIWRATMCAYAVFAVRSVELEHFLPVRRSRASICTQVWMKVSSKVVSMRLAKVKRLVRYDGDTTIRSSQQAGYFKSRVNVLENYAVFFSLLLADATVRAVDICDKPTDLNTIFFQIKGNSQLTHTYSLPFLVWYLIPFYSILKYLVTGREPETITST